MLAGALGVMTCISSLLIMCCIRNAVLGPSDGGVVYKDLDSELDGKSEEQEEVEGLYNQRLQQNPVLRRLLAAFVQPLDDPVMVPSPSPEVNPKGSGTKGKSPSKLKCGGGGRGGNRGLVKMESLDDESISGAGDFELDWADMENTNSPPPKPPRDGNIACGGVNGSRGHSGNSTLTSPMRSGGHASLPANYTSPVRRESNGTSVRI